VTECMKKNTNIIRCLSFRFSAENECPFSFSFHSRSKMQNAFLSASSIHHKKVLVLLLRCRVLVLVLNTRLGLVLGLERILKS